jgi:S1-C subfamily serine protease
VKASQGNIPVLVASGVPDSDAIGTALSVVLPSLVEVKLPSVTEESASCSGFVVDADKGYIVTAYHEVVKAADHIEVVLPGGLQIQPEWVRSDPLSDIALIKIRPMRGLKALSFRDSDKVAEGDVVLAVGTPRSERYTISVGEAKPWKKADCRLVVARIHIDWANSGGPLVDLRGSVVGIATNVATREARLDAYGLAVPSNIVKAVVTQLAEKGRVVRGYIGVRFEEQPPVGKKDAASVVVTAVFSGGPAEKAGLLPQDQIIAVNGTPIRDGWHLRDVVSGMAPGVKAAIRVRRAGKEISLDVVAAEMPSAEVLRRLSE